MYGRIEVICGSMFAGKTSELVRRLKRAVFAKEKVLAFSYAIDHLSVEQPVLTHDNVYFESKAVGTMEEIVKAVKDEGAAVVGISEAHFFRELAEGCQEMAENGVRVIVEGNDMSIFGTPLTNMGILMCLADDVTKLHGICDRCGKEASLSTPRVDKGGNQTKPRIRYDSYQPVCHDCFGKKRIFKKNN